MAYAVYSIAIVDYYLFFIIQQTDTARNLCHMILFTVFSCRIEGPRLPFVSLRKTLCCTAATLSPNLKKP